MLSLKEAVSSIESEIIVVDNNSIDDSCEVIEKHFPEIILLKNKHNMGFAKANNQGVALARGEYICFLNPDTIVTSGTFKRMINTSRELPNAGLLGPRLINGVGDYLHESKRNIPSPLTSLRRLFGIKLGYVKSYYADHIPNNSVGDVDVLVGAFMLTKKKYYTAAGGFDEDYFMYGEDLDLSYKFKKKGHQNYYIGSVTAIHYRGESTDRNATYIKRFYEAMRLFYKKHFKSDTILDTMVSVAIRVVAGIQSFRNFDKKKNSIEQYYLISEDKNLSRDIASALDDKITIVESIKKEDLGDKNIEIIFDNNFISFDEIIDKMQEFRKHNVTFKIRPKNRSYLLGSDFSDGKGEVITF
ncbi:glycosyltransferase family 2 protein [Aquimarina gracilis]